MLDATVRRPLQGPFATPPRMKPRKNTRIFEVTHRTAGNSEFLNVISRGTAREILQVPNFINSSDKSETTPWRRSNP